MADNSYYWANKAARTKVAKAHTKKMAEKYAKEIEDSIKNTHRYDGNLKILEGKHDITDVTMEVYRGDSVSAALDLCEAGKKTAVLNFASYKYAGGGFMNGSRAQEECLCHESFLYNVLSAFEDSYYVPNRTDLNKALYKDKALYSPNIRFVRNEREAVCDVLTCAAPNYSTAKKHVTLAENNQALRYRVRFILEIAKRENVDTFILGAWGCGVFEQDPKTLAQYFAEESEKVLVKHKIRLVFAVIPPLPNQTDNLTPFVEMVEAERR